jgi:hypothetical protein
MLVGDEIPLTNASTLRLGSFNDGCAYNKLACRIIVSDITTKEDVRNFFILRTKELCNYYILPMAISFFFYTQVSSDNIPSTNNIVLNCLAKSVTVTIPTTFPSDSMGNLRIL